MNESRKVGVGYLFFIAIIIILGIGRFQRITFAQETQVQEKTVNRSAGWLEPRGINVADLVGILPEDVLRDAIVTWDVDNGVAQYESGSRQGNNVSLSVKYGVSNKNELFCLGKTVTEDEYPSPVLAMSMRVFDGNTDVTTRVANTFRYSPISDNTQPVGPPNTRFRYAEVENATIQRNTNGSIQLPANTGCNFTVTGAALTNPRAEFTFESPVYFSATPIYRTQATFHSYVGGGAGGTGNHNFNSLQAQMSGKYGFRHDGWKPDIINGDPLRIQLFEADYVFVNFPPQPVNPWAHGAVAPGSGSHRFMFSNGSWSYQSVDHSTTTLMPFHTQWRDVDQSGSVQFLPTQTIFDRLHADFPYQTWDEIKAPEYFLPPGVPYNSCMTNGGCSDAILASVFNASYQVDISFYKVERIYPDLVQIPLKLVGNGYSGRAEGSAVDSAQVDNNRPTVSQPISQPETITLENAVSTIFLPMIETPFIIPDDNPNAGCPCGWFDQYGRMFDFVPAP